VLYYRILLFNVYKHDVIVSVLNRDFTAIYTISVSNSLLCPFCTDETAVDG